MKKLIAVAAVVLAAGAAQADVTRYYTTFAPEGGSGRTGSGSAFASFDDATNEFSFFADFSGLSGVTTQAHFHCCTTTAFSGTAGVAVDSPSLPIPLGVSAGSFGTLLDLDDASNFNPAFITASGGLGAAITRFKAGLDSGKVYLNIHTDTFRGGEIRGFMLVPEPGSAALALLAMAALGAAGARSRRA